MSATVVFVTLTDFTTINGPSGFTTLPSSSSTNIAPTTLPHITLTSASSTPTAPRTPPNNVLATAALVSSVVLAVVYMIALCFFCYQRHKGKCMRCDDKDARIKDLEDTRYEPIITKDRVKLREKTEELEKTRKKVKELEYEKILIDEARASALAHLEGKGDEDEGKLGFATWVSEHERRYQATLDSDEGEPVMETDSQRESGDRYFRPASSAQASYPQLHVPPKAVTRPASSKYSQPPRIFGEHIAEDYPQDTTTLNTRDCRAPDTYSQYMNNNCYGYGAPPPVPPIPPEPTTPFPSRAMEQINSSDFLAQEYRKACFISSNTDNPHHIREDARKAATSILQEMTRRTPNRTCGKLPNLNEYDGFDDVEIGDEDLKVDKGETRTWREKMRGVVGLK